MLYNDKTYFLDESGPGYLYENDSPPAKEFIYWDFIDKEDENSFSNENHLYLLLS